ncbi:MAG: AAA family ATPase [Candidatus Amulumruptor caecigallinarius]|nr:AAA family ATPase [Candidatus Amulumruptor caecigallinarius]MCM1454017.1 AAA family ATPase [bacterium]
MIIRKINSIKDFGIYQNFSWNGDTKDFQEKNIIYGWNYSGKTTLSRFFSLLPTISMEEAKKIGYKLSLKNSDGSTTECDSSITGLNIHIFNSDYVAQNLHFEQPDNPKIKGILFDIGEASLEKRQQLNDTKTKIAEIKDWINSNHNYIDDFSKFEDKIFTQEARLIKNEAFESQIEFNKFHLKKILETLNLSEIDRYVISDIEILRQVRANALAKQAMALVNFVPFSSNLNEILDDVNEILIQSPSKIKDEPVLNSSSEMYQWGEIGLAYYKAHSAVKTCAFCGNILNSARIEELNRFYTNEASKLRTKINLMLEKLNSLMEEANLHFLRIISSNDLSESLRTNFDSLRTEYLHFYIEIKDFINSLINALKNKEHNSLFEALPKLDMPNNLYRRFEDCRHRILIIINKHNAIISNFDSIKQQSVKKLKLHHVARMLKEKEYPRIKRLKELQEKENLEKTRELEKLEQLFQGLQSELKSLTKGKENLNKFIQRFLGRNDLEIHTIEDNYFILKRGNEIAKLLSEGEKTAIALSYFFVSLESLKNDGILKNSIIVFDDPISSLDANHIAQVSSLINSFFFFKDRTGKVCEHFAQLFILTHNFEFFSFIRDANNIKRQPKEGKSGASCAIFMLKRINENRVEICKLPSAFSKYNSEYLYLFSEIYKYYDEGCPEDKSYMMPNIIRRFLEIYTLIKLPGNHDEINSRIQILMGDGVNELKILHHFSHFTSLERVTKHSELILKLPDMTEDLFKILHKDLSHYESLLEGIGKKGREPNNVL